ncbi:tripartite tricarboxylate transporter permease [Ureibacillus acetophenoni]
MAFIKGFISMGIGLIISTVGIDLQEWCRPFYFRLTFYYQTECDFLVVIIGIYAVGDDFVQLLNNVTISIEQKTKYGRVWISRTRLEGFKMGDVPRISNWFLNRYFTRCGWLNCLINVLYD